MAVGGFAFKNQFGSVPVQLLTPGNEFLDALGPFVQQSFYRFRAAQSVACDESVLQVQNDLIFVAERGLESNGRGRRTGVPGLFFRQYQHTSSDREFNRGTQPGNAGADYYEVCLGWKTFHKPQNGTTSGAHAIKDVVSIGYDGIPMAQVTIHVPARPYQARIENGLLARSGALLAEVLPQASKVFVVTVPPVRRRWGAKLVRSLVSAGFKPQVIQMPNGEPAKKLSTIETLAERLSRLGADRKAVLIALGGGVVGDVTGLLASLYMRGVELVQIPTTVQAQVDASVGGKTGVNLGAGKNLLGTFHHPRAVLIDPEVLRTLPDREFRAGLYEALKCGIIGDLDLFLRFEQKRALILKRDPVELEGVITQSVKLKAEVVSADEHEGGLRRVLNLGHTIGHALEAETGYRSLLHGEAVAWGMIAATNIALTVGRTDSVTAGRIADAVLSLGRLPELKVSARKILARLQADKKTQSGVVHFVLPREIGKVEIAADVPDSVVIGAVEELRRLSRGGWGK